MNPFAEHSLNMKSYGDLLSEPVISSVKENTITISAGTFPAIVGKFVHADILVDGGLQKHLMGEVIVQKSDLPAGTYFTLGQNITAVEIGGGVHTCRVHESHNVYAEWRLQLIDENEGA